MKIREARPEAGKELFEGATTPEDIQKQWLIATVQDMAANSTQLEDQTPMLFVRGWREGGEVVALGFPDNAGEPWLWLQSDVLRSTIELHDFDLISVGYLHSVDENGIRQSASASFHRSGEVPTMTMSCFKDGAGVDMTPDNPSVLALPLLFSVELCSTLWQRPEATDQEVVLDEGSMEMIEDALEEMRKQENGTGIAIASVNGIGFSMGMGGEAARHEDDMSMFLTVDTPASCHAWAAASTAVAYRVGDEEIARYAGEEGTVIYRDGKIVTANDPYGDVLMCANRRDVDWRQKSINLAIERMKPHMGVPEEELYSWLNESLQWMLEMTSQYGSLAMAAAEAANKAAGISEDD